MAGVAIRVIQEDEQVRQMFRGIRGNLGNMKPGMEIVGAIVRTSVVKNFEVGGRPFWKKSQRAIKAGGVTLTKTRRLAKSINYKASSVAVDIGSNVIYARIHQLGGEIKHPARERVIHFQQENRGKITFGRPGTGDRFAKPAKAHFALKVQGRAYSIHMPQRQFLMVQDEDWKEIIAALEEFILVGGVK